MIQSYFFVPASHPKLKEKLNAIQTDFFIIDLEDAFDCNQLDNSLKLLERIKDKESFWIRPRIFLNNDFNSDLLKVLFDLGFINFVIPKVRNISHLNQVEQCLGRTINVILLVENPECLVNLKDILGETKLNITGVGFGSQDYSTETGMKHEQHLLRFPRFIIVTTAKAFGISCIDIACMEVRDEEIFRNEVSEAISMGFDGKFIIHPNQLDILNNYPVYSQADIEEAEQVLAEYERLGNPSVFVFNGRAIEPPHIKNYSKIKAWRLKYGKQ
jgi:citrate lyase beta subunit